MNKLFDIDWIKNLKEDLFFNKTTHYKKVMS